MSRPDITPLSEMLVPTLRRTNKYMGLYMESQLLAAKSGLTLKQFVLLYHINAGERSQSHLAFITDRDKGSLTRILQSLERKGMVSRASQSTDRRMNIVEITPLGRRRLADASLVIQGAFSEITEVLTADEQEQMRQFSRRMMERAQQLLTRTETSAQ